MAQSSWYPREFILLNYGPLQFNLLFCGFFFNLVISTSNMTAFRDDLAHR